MDSYSNTQVKPQEILIVIMHAHRDPWSEIALSGQCKTWVPDLIRDGFSIGYAFCTKLNRLSRQVDFIDMHLRYKCGVYIATLRNFINFLSCNLFKNLIPLVKIKENLFGINNLLFLEQKLPDLYITGRWKRLSILNYFIKCTTFKFLIITTSSSYINGSQLLKSLQFLPERCVGGRLVGTKPTEEFVSGSFSVYDKSGARLLLKSRKYMPVHLLDDLSFRQGQQKANLDNFELSSSDISTENNIGDQIVKNRLETCHFRLKSLAGGKRNDAKLMQLLHEKMFELR